MKKKELLALVGSACLALMLAALPLMAACGRKEVTPTPTPAHELVTLELYTNPAGGIMYTLGFALADLINEHSEWLRCNAVETSSSAENLRTIAEHPEKKNIWLGESTTITADMLALGRKPFEDIGPWKHTKWIGLMVNIGSAFVTLDPNIETWHDLEGKTFGLDVMGSTNQFMEEDLMEYAWKNKDKVKIDYGCTGDIAVDRLLDGTVDITWQGAICMGSGEYKEWVPMPSFERLLAARQVYFMELDESDIATVREETGLESLGLIGGEAKTVGKTDATNWKGLINCIGWLVSEDMDDEIVTEIMRIIYDYSGEFVNYHAVGRGITHETLGQLSVPRESYHPAAIKFLEDRGHKVGR